MPELRPLAPAHLHDALAIVHDAVGDTAYEPSLVEWLRSALAAPGEEARGTGAWAGEELAGVMVHGAFAGAVGAGRLHLVAVAPGWRAQGVGLALVTHAVTELRAHGARFLLAEVPDDAEALGDYWAFLARCWFHEEARVDGLVREGIALAFLRRDLAA
ncbi:MAG TPA: GNAT family N-acetyltransferase [Gemmatimonadaceae bacterium]|nr:GNAT family N-acetyltransferase [Gemmatimonadaceae bacterium]